MNSVQNKNIVKFPLVKPLDTWISSLFKDTIPKKLLIRVDAGRIMGLSFGHLSRCLILSKVLKKVFNTSIVFIMRNIMEGVNLAIQSDETVITLSKDIPEIEENKIIVEHVKKINPDWFLIDLPYNDMDTSYFSIIKKIGVQLLYIDDFRFVNPGGDVYINTHILATDRVKPIDNNIKYFLGPEFLIFNDSLIDNTIKPPLDYYHIVISFGGSDPTELTKKVLTSLSEEKLPLNLKFSIILGPGYKDDESIISIIKCHKDQYDVYKSPENIISFFQKSHLVICAGGRTLYELLYLNKRCLPIASAKWEAETIEAFIDKNYLESGLTNWNRSKFISEFKRISNSL